jgi:hypothetical protein
MREMANSFMLNMIIMEEDSGSNHPNGKLPVLDVEFWIQDKFCKKPMATREVMARSAM